MNTVIQVYRCTGIQVYNANPVAYRARKFSVRRRHTDVRHPRTSQKISHNIYYLLFSVDIIGDNTALCKPCENLYAVGGHNPAVNRIMKTNKPTGQVGNTHLRGDRGVLMRTW